MKVLVGKYKLFITISLLILALAGCSSAAKTQSAGGDLFSLKNSYIGDNSAVGEIVRQLPASEKLDKIILETDQKPYGLHLSYHNTNQPISLDELKQTIVYNATFIFALIPNVERITFTVDQTDFVLQRDELQKWYDERELNQFESADELKGFIEEYISNQQKIDDLLK